MADSNPPDPPDLDFKGTIGATWQESEPWWPDPVKPRPILEAAKKLRK